MLRGAVRKRSPSFGRQTRTSRRSPASIATTLRVAPAVAYSTPPIISGVVSLFISGFGPKLPPYQRHAIFEIFDVARVDLVERRVVLRREAAAVDGPFDDARLPAPLALPSSATATTPHSAASHLVSSRSCTQLPPVANTRARASASSDRRRILQQRERHDLERARMRALSNTRGAMPCSCASSQRAAHRHQRSPGLSPGN